MLVSKPGEAGAFTYQFSAHFKILVSLEILLNLDACQAGIHFTFLRPKMEVLKLFWCVISPSFVLANLNVLQLIFRSEYVRSATGYAIAANSAGSSTSFGQWSNRLPNCLLPSPSLSNQFHQSKSSSNDPSNVAGNQFSFVWWHLKNDDVLWLFSVSEILEKNYL